MGYCLQEYDKLIEELFEKHPTVQKDGFASGAYKPGLAGMSAFDKALGNPWRHFRCIHVAGTNGKGSVSSMVATALAASGLRVGLYTSPHLLDFRERMKIIRKNAEDGLQLPSSDAGGRISAKMVSREYVYDFLKNTEVGDLSFFEITTGLAFKWFDDCGVDVAVIEVGLGGLLDSTNVITPEFSIVTSIGLDHCAMLGNTRAEIAAQKAGIFKPGVPALVWGHDEETDGVFTRIAGENGSALHFADSEDTGMGNDSFERLLAGLDLQGPCQRVNLRTALAALKLLGVSDYAESLLSTAEATAFRGRWERLSDHPEAICDIGHNPAALKTNFARLESLGRPLKIVYGIMADKDLDGIAPLMPAGADYILVAPATSRSLGAERLQARLSELRPELRTRTAASVAEGVAEAFREAECTPGCLVYIGGSTFVVSEAVASLSSKQL